MKVLQLKAREGFLKGAGAQERPPAALSKKAVGGG